jgi:cellobiose phosphorylase
MEAHSGEVRVDGREHFQTPHSEIPRTRIISNSEYSVFIDQSGSGFSSFKSDFSINRFRADNLRNNFGQYCYIRDEESKKFWSTTYQPTLVKPDKYEAIFYSDKAEFQRRNYDINSVMEVIVSPEDNVEIRKVSLTNHSKSIRKLSLTSFFEVSQSSFGADLAHPAFSKLFIEADWLSEQEALTFKRRKRSANEQTPLVFHFIATDVVWAPTEFTANRAEFLGRGRDASRPDVIASGLKLSGEKGFVLDPAASIRHYVELDTNQSTAIYYITGVAENETELLYLISKYREFHTIKRAYELSWSTANVELKNQQFAKVNPLDFQYLANALIYNVKHLRYSDATQLNILSQSALWRFGISGDEPIALLILDVTRDLRTSRAGVSGWPNAPLRR